MSAIQLHSTLPESSSDAYKPFQTVDFLLDVRGRKLMKNTIRIEGNIVAKDNVSGGADITSASGVKLENAIGAHAFFDSFTVETEGKGVIQTLQNYPRHQNMVSRATMTSDDMLSSTMLAEARGPVEENGNYVLQKVADNAFVLTKTAAVATNAVAPSFSIRPGICFNRMGGDDYSFQKNGFIRVSMILSAANECLFGGADNAKDYTLTDLQCRFQTSQDDGTQGPMLMKSYVNVVSSVQSTSTTVSARVPSASVNGVSMSFINQTDVRSNQKNSQELQRLPQWSNIEFLFNNSLQEYLTYTIRDESTALQLGLEALETAGHSQVSSKTLKGNNGMIFGLPFNSYIDLSNQKFTVNFKIDSPSITANPMDVLMYFSTLLTM